MTEEKEYTLGIHAEGGQGEEIDFTWDVTAESAEDAKTRYLEAVDHVEHWDIQIERVEADA